MGGICFAAYKAVFAFLNSNTIATITAIFIAVIVYGLVMLLIGGIKEEDLKAMPMGGRLVRIFKRYSLI